jgi:hypothetical protein
MTSSFIDNSRSKLIDVIETFEIRDDFFMLAVQILFHILGFPFGSADSLADAKANIRLHLVSVFRNIL